MLVGVDIRKQLGTHRIQYFRPNENEATNIVRWNISWAENRCHNVAPIILKTHVFRPLSVNRCIKYIYVRCVYKYTRIYVYARHYNIIILKTSDHK